MLSAAFNPYTTMASLTVITVLRNSRTLPPTSHGLRCVSCVCFAASVTNLGYRSKRATFVCVLLSFVSVEERAFPSSGMGPPRFTTHSGKRYTKYQHFGLILHSRHQTILTYDVFVFRSNISSYILTMKMKNDE